MNLSGDSLTAYAKYGTLPRGQKIDGAGLLGIAGIMDLKIGIFYDERACKCIVTICCKPVGPCQNCNAQPHYCWQVAADKKLRGLATAPALRSTPSLRAWKPLPGLGSSSALQWPAVNAAQHASIPL